MADQRVATTQNDRLSSKQKAALLVLSLDVETATKVMRELSQEEIENLTVEISNIRIDGEKVTSKEGKLLSLPVLEIELSMPKPPA